jgi:hypothetical protein
MVKARRFSGVKTKPSVLESLPQFQPETNFDIDHIEPETGEYRAFSATRQAELGQLLNERIRLHLQKFEQKGQEARLKRFLKAALSAIATYEHQREEQASFDRVCRNVRIGETLLGSEDEDQEVSRWTDGVRKPSVASGSLITQRRTGT